MTRFEPSIVRTSNADKTTPAVLFTFRPLALYDPITIRVFHVKTFYRAARGAQVSKKGLPFLPFGPFEKVFVFLFAEEAGMYVTTTTRSRNSETADEL